MKTIKVTEMNAYDRGRKVRIFVSDIVRNTYCEDEKVRYGWWYCVKGGEVGYFTTRRPTSGCRISNKDCTTLSMIERFERDIFNVNGKIDTAERFAELVGMQVE